MFPVMNERFPCMGMTLKWADFKETVKFPKIILTGVLLQYFVMPLSAYLISKSFGLTPEYIAELKSEQGANLNEADLPWFMVELNGPRRMETIWDGLKRRRLSDREIEKIMGANVRRVYSETIA